MSRGAVALRAGRLFAVALIAVTGVLAPACGEDPAPLEATPAGDLAGVVTATDSSRVATTLLTLEDVGGGGLVTQTDVGGAYFFGPITAGEWTLRIEPPTGFVLATDETAERMETIRENEVTEVNFRVTPVSP